MLGGWVRRALRPRPVIVVRRRSPDWTRIDAAYWEDLAAFERTIGRAPGSVRTLIETWNAAMAVSFFDVRERMKQITNANLKRLRGAKVIDVSEYRAGIDPEALYVFTDDDDWFAPEIAPELRSVSTERDGIVWRSLKYSGVLDRRKLDGYAYTNNYAVFGRVLARRPEWVTPVEEHFTLMPLVDGGELRLETVEMSLAVTNKHPCSTVTLEKAAAQFGPAPEDFRRWVAAIKADYAGVPDLPVSGAAWAKPEIDAVRRVIAAL